MAIIGVSGKINSGKDTVGRIIQYLVDKNNFGYNTPDSENDYNSYFSNKHNLKSNWKIVKYADALKDIVCILTGCTRKQLENIDFKNSKLPDGWIRYGKADGFIKKYIGNGDMGEPVMNNKQCTKEEYEEELKTNWQTAYLSHLTYRELLQYLGTDLLRNQLHGDVWVNALFADIDKELNANPNYNRKQVKKGFIITDTRFENELKAVKDRGGITIRVNRPYSTVVGQGNGNWATFSDTQFHPSETSLDSATFDFIINNDRDIEHLVNEVKKILEKSNII